MSITITETEPVAESGTTEKYILRYKDGEYPALDFCSNCAIDYMTDRENYKDLEFSSLKELKQFQSEVHAGVCCCQIRNVCLNLWYNCCQPCEEVCGTGWCVLFEIPYCILVATPWFCCCHNRVINGAERITDA